jgi:hypothetical protein
MPYRVEEVVLVSSLYDAFILQEDGHISGLLLEGGELSMRDAPQIVRIPDAEDALQYITRSKRNVLVMVTPQMGDIHPVVFAQEVKRNAGAVPVVLLGYDAASIRNLLSHRGSGPFDGVFLWSGDSNILNAIVTLVEDRANCLHDCEQVGVRCILLVEDSLNFLSSYLPLLYSEIMHQSRSVLLEGVNLPDKIHRLRARPKLLLARDLHDARILFDEYRDHLLGVISDVGIPRERNAREPDATAGADFVKHVRSVDAILPVMMQSARPENAEVAKALDVHFVRKGSSLLHEEVRGFLLDHFGFGPFRFSREGHEPEIQARTLQELEAAVREASAEAVRFHAERNHFSTWLRARTRFHLADRLEATPAETFRDGEELRGFLLGALRKARHHAQRGAIVDFHRGTYDETIHFARIGKGSLGGKARGIAFVNRLLPAFLPEGELADVRVVVPPSVVLTTEVFDNFLRRNQLHHTALGPEFDEAQRRSRFLHGRFPAKVISDLRALLRAFSGPLAVRSSSLLEDSHHQPFAGIYETVMIRNNGSERERLAELCDAIKAVYASTYSDRARAYLNATAYRHEEEKMAVIIQPVFGRERNGRVYPTFSGVARSHNYYPHGQCGPEDGVCVVGMGLGRLLVAGEGGVRFCPRRPQSLPEFSTVDDILANAQRYFYALPLEEEQMEQHVAEGAVCVDQFQPCRYPIPEADRDGVLPLLASTYLAEDHRITDGVSRTGHRLVTFANILKHGSFPLAPLVRKALKIGHRAMGCAVEMEFAVDLEGESGEPQNLALLQIRPMAMSEAEVDLDLDRFEDDLQLCSSNRALGNGRIEGIRDIVFVDPADFDRATSLATARQIAQLNAQLQKEGLSYLLVGPGRWGSQDPWLGIPVDWSEISQARVLVETGFEGMRVTPSEGSHFFHNMTSFRVGYFTVNPHTGEGTLDLDWLRSQETVGEVAEHVRHLRLKEPLEVLLDGRAARGLILKRESRIDS